MKYVWTVIIFDPEDGTAHGLMSFNDRISAEALSVALNNKTSIVSTVVEAPIT